MKLKIKKGFTLAELLGIIIILGVITLIAFPIINKMIKDSKLDAYDAQVKTIIEAARTWAVNNPDRLPGINSTKEENVKELLKKNKELANEIEDKVRIHYGLKKETKKSND